MDRIRVTNKSAARHNRGGRAVRSASARSTARLKALMGAPKPWSPSPIRPKVYPPLIPIPTRR